MWDTALDMHHTPDFGHPMFQLNGVLDNGSWVAGAIRLTGAMPMALIMLTGFVPPKSKGLLADNRHEPV